VGRCPTWWPPCRIYVAPSAQRRNVWLTPTTRVPCSNAANIGRRKTWAQKWILHLAKFRYGVRAPEKVYIVYQPWNGQTSCKVWLASVEECRCSNEAKTRNQFKFAGEPQTNKPILAASGLKFTILWRRVGRYRCLTIFPIVDTCLRCKDIARQSRAFVRRWRIFGDFWVLYFQRTACSTFQISILNSH